MTATPLQKTKQANSSLGRRYLSRIAYAREYVLLGGLFVLVVAGLWLVTYTGVEMLSVARGYTNAEALYSKAQKEAVYYLHRYALSGQQDYYDKFQQAMVVPLGYRRVREELEKARPNPAVIRQGMVQGHSHPDDAHVPVALLRVLRHLGAVSRPMEVWRQADRQVTELLRVAQLVHAEVASDTTDAARVAELLQEAERININLTTLQEAFSSVLGEAARRVRHIVLLSVLVASGLLLALGLVPSWRILKRLKDSEEKFRRLFEQSRDAIVFVTPEGRIGYANPAARQLFGYAEVLPDQVAAIDVADHVVGSEKLSMLQEVLQEEGFAQNVEMQLCRQDGTVVDCLISAVTVRDQSGRVLGYEGMLRDISERKRTERRMRLLERAVEASGNVIVISDATRPDFPLVYVNPAFERMTGYTTEEAMGQDGFFLLNGQANGDVASKVDMLKLKEALRSGLESRIVIRHVRKDGTPFWSELSFAPVYDADGALINYVGIQTDVTEVKEAEETLKQALEKERELSELQTRFVSMASHEFRTPLAAILSSAELVERFRDRWPEARTLKHLRRIQSAVHTLTNLLENVLVIGKVEAGRLHFTPETVEVNAFCRELIEEIELGHDAEHPLRVELLPDPVEMTADPHLLRYVLNNLFTNAIKYSPEATPVSFCVACDDDRAVFRVADQGIGIPEEDLPTIFEPFRRAGNAETIPGTGLGLAITKRAVEMHGGTITVESEEGHGTVVLVSIPLASREDPAPATS